MKKLKTCYFALITGVFIVSCGGGSDSQTPVISPPIPPASIVKDILTDSVTVNKIYLDGEAQITGTSKGILWRENNTAQWQDRSPNANGLQSLAIISEGHYIAAMQVEGADPYTEPSPLYFTQDSGQHWQIVNHNFGRNEYSVINNIAYDQTNNLLYAVGDTSFAVSDTSAENWTLLDGTWDGFASGLALLIPHPSQNFVWFGGQGPIENGYLKRYSMVDGSVTTWTDLLPNPSVFKGGMIHPTDKQTVIFGSEGGIVVSTDNGENWIKPLGDVNHLFYWDIVIDDEGNLYTASYNKQKSEQPLEVLCSSDNGVTWISNNIKEVDKGGVKSLLMVQTDTHNELYLGLWDNGIKSIKTSNINCS
ncbi:sialidase family protein [Thalassotalea profundi]|uniref:Exo-alpha-sialidase n=1 Tax=Thalassotalea profundi TaxID=2036687 RepID=A0ABQ3IEG8_9GAMM|nr:hypothetical protein [Thalassotalea profundi]GHE78957.1 hypothetical protein GCM10011501_03580 [Thalassotalea profundi]